MHLLRPLLLDVVPTIQQTAALALGRLANYNDDLAEAVVKGDILPQLVYSLAEQNVRMNSWHKVSDITCPYTQYVIEINAICFFLFLINAYNYRDLLLYYNVLLTNISEILQESCSICSQSSS